MMLNKKWEKAADKDELITLVLRSDTEFKALEYHWKELYKKALKCGASFHQAYNQWKLIAKEGQHDLLIITIWDGTLLIGVAPLYKKHFSSTASALSSRQNTSNSAPLISALITDKNYSGIMDFSPITVDSSYPDLFAERLVDMLNSSFLGANLLELKKSDNYAHSYLYPKLQKQLQAVD